MDTSIFPMKFDLQNEATGLAYLDDNILLVSTRDNTIALQHASSFVRRLNDQPYRFGSDIPIYAYNRTVYGFSYVEGQLWSIGLDAGRLRSDLTPIGDQVPLFPSWLQEWFKATFTAAKTINNARISIIDDSIFLNLNAFESSDLDAESTNIVQNALSTTGHYWLELFFYHNWGIWAYNYGESTGTVALLEIQPGPHRLPIAHNQENFIVQIGSNERDDAIRHSGNYLSVADAGGGDIRVATSSAHGLAIGDVVTLTGTYTSSLKTITKVTDTTHFDITETYSSTGTGTYYQGTNVKSITSVIEIPDKFISRQKTSSGLLLGFPVRIPMESVYLKIGKAKTDAISATLSITPYNDGVAGTPLTKTAITADGMIRGISTGYSDSYVIKITDASSGTLRLAGIDVTLVDRGGRVQ